MVLHGHAPGSARCELGQWVSRSASRSRTLGVGRTIREPQQGSWRDRSTGITPKLTCGRSYKPRAKRASANVRRCSAKLAGVRQEAYCRNCSTIDRTWLGTPQALSIWPFRSTARSTRCSKSGVQVFTDRNKDTFRFAAANVAESSKLATMADAIAAAVKS